MPSNQSRSPRRNPSVTGTRCELAGPDWVEVTIKLIIFKYLILLSALLSPSSDLILFNFKSSVGALRDNQRSYNNSISLLSELHSLTRFPVLSLLSSASHIFQIIVHMVMCPILSLLLHHLQTTTQGVKLIFPIELGGFTVLLRETSSKVICLQNTYPKTGHELWRAEY